jgi:hypothetical protein
MSIGIRRDTMAAMSLSPLLTGAIQSVDRSALPPEPAQAAAQNLDQPVGETRSVAMPLSIFGSLRDRNTDSVCNAIEQLEDGPLALGISA